MPIISLPMWAYPIILLVFIPICAVIDRLVLRVDLPQEWKILLHIVLLFIGGMSATIAVIIFMPSPIILALPRNELFAWMLIMTLTGVFMYLLHLVDSIGLKNNNHSAHNA